MNCKLNLLTKRLNKIYLILTSNFVIPRSHARFLWKRIPRFMKTGNTELEHLYKVFESLWNNKNAQFYSLIEFNWSPKIANVMAGLKGD